MVTTTLAAATLGEFLTPLQLVGGLLVLSSVVVLQGPAWGRRRRRTRTVEPALPLELRERVEAAPL